MSTIKVSIDRIVVEYKDVYWDFFNPFKQRLCDYYGIKEYIKQWGYKYHLHIKESADEYLHISYQQWGEGRSRKHTLQIETNPLHLNRFSRWLLPLQNQSSSIRFVRSEIAYDIPYPMTNVFTSSLTGRRMNLYEGTRYYGKKSQRQQHGYCRVYDKRAERLEKNGIDIGHELTRMEIVYRPEEKIILQNLIQHPPEFNGLYSCKIITETTSIKPIRRAMLLAVQHQHMTLQDFSGHHKRELKKALDAQQHVDLNLLAQQHWDEMVTVPCAMLCGAVNRGLAS